MTTQEMHNAVRLGVQTLDSYTHDLILPQEIDVVLNQMQDKFIKQRYYFLSNTKGVGFEESKKRLHDLQLIVKSTNVYTDDDVILVPSDCLYLISIQEDIVYLGIPLNNVKVEIVEHEKLLDLLNNPFRTTTHKNILATLQGQELTLHTQNKFILIGCKFTYIKTPSVIDISLPDSTTCELSEHTHNEIVEMAVQNILEKIESPRYKTIINENINNE